MTENVIIIGAGISGLSSAIYTARANLKPKVITGMAEGGQLMLTTEVENFPGFPEGINGPELIENAKKQAERFGAEFIVKDVTKVEKTDRGIVVHLDNEKIVTKTLIIATGASARMLGLKSEQKYVGRGVSTCATCDAFFYKDKIVAVVGGGDAAAEEALTLTKFASKVYVIHRRDQLRASKIMADRLINHEKIEMVWDSGVEEVLGNEKGVTGLKLKNFKTDEIKELKVDGMFLGIGHIPNTKFLEGFVDLDDKGYVVVTSNVKTGVEGVYASGDVADHKYMQAITASATGVMAALDAEKFVEGNPEISK